MIPSPRQTNISKKDYQNFTDHLSKTSRINRFTRAIGLTGDSATARLAKAAQKVFPQFFPSCQRKEKICRA